jgi:hypothetical protein
VPNIALGLLDAAVGLGKLQLLLEVAHAWCSRVTE